MITSGSDSGIESTLNANVSSLRETLIECSSGDQIRNNTTVQELQGTVRMYKLNDMFVAPPSTSSTPCSLLLLPGGPSSGHPPSPVNMLWRGMV